jgi:transposase
VVLYSAVGVSGSSGTSLPALLGRMAERQSLADLLSQARNGHGGAVVREAAHLVIDTGRTIAVVAREIGVGEQLLGRWVAVERSRVVDPPGAVGEDERGELERLRVENAELRMDREFLKKAAAFFASEQQPR